MRSTIIEAQKLSTGWKAPLQLFNWTNITIKCGWVLSDKIMNVDQILFSPNKDMDSCNHI